MSRSDTRTADRDAATRREEPQRVDARTLKREVARLEAALREQTRLAAEARETEREALARELHDKFGQYLTVMEMELAALGDQPDATPPLRLRLKKLRSLTGEARQEMADMAWQLRPGAPPGLDLEAACGRLTQEWAERSGLSFDLHLALGGPPLPAAVEATLYRVLQEALTNVAKHAGATQVGVILRAEAGQVLLIVEDNGGGFVLDEAGTDDAPFATLGLRGVQERLMLVSGTLEIETGPGRGTTLLVRVPL